jgi:FMN-dependent NADH-azoreductase
MNVLHVCGSPRPIAESASKQLAAAFFAKLAEVNPDADVTNVDLYNNPPPYVSCEAYRALWQPVFEDGYEPKDSEKKAAAYAEAQSTLLADADVLVLTMPLWNGGMPAIMKAWLDQALVPNKIFNPEPDALHAMHHVSKVILLVSSAGVLKEGDRGDALTPQIDAVLSMIGVSDLAVAWADGQDPKRYPDCEERKKMALEAAQELAEEIAGLP